MIRFSSLYQCFWTLLSHFSSILFLTAKYHCKIRRSGKIFLGGFINFFPLTLGVTAHAATYYVAKTGNDSNHCTQAQNASTPKLTIPSGVACLSGGDTLVVKAGIYTNQAIVNPPAGNAGSYTIIKADPSGARPVIDPDGERSQKGFNCDRGSACSYIEVRGFEIRTAYNFAKLFGNDAKGYPHHVRFIDNIMHDSIDAGILISSSDSGYEGGDHLIQRNVFYNTGSGTPGYAPGFNTIYNPGNRTVIEGNTFHNLANGVGIRTPKKYLQNIIVRNNVFYDIGRDSIDAWEKGNESFSAVHISSPGGGHQIYNNIIFRSGDESSFTGIRINPIGDAKNTTNIQVYNNTVYNLKNPRAYAIRVVPASGGPYLIKNNIAFHAGVGIEGGTQSNNLTGDPLFVNAATGDFGLQKTSPAINAGAALPQVAADFEGQPRPAGSAYDLGAFEGAGSRANAIPSVDGYKNFSKE